MARRTDYEGKINKINSKIENHQEAIKKLKAQLADLEAKKAEDDYKDLVEYMKENSLSATDVIAKITNQENQG